MISSHGQLMANSLWSLLWSAFVQCDAAEPWQIGFQDGASPTFEGITELHNAIFFYLVLIFVGVMWVMGSMIINYSSTASPISHKYSNHGTLIELVWTISPAFILIAIAFPSFKLLYLMDSPELEGVYLVSSVVSIARLSSPCTQLVLHGNMGNTANMRYNKYSIASTYFPKAIVSQLVGHLLGDGALTMTYTSVNPYFVWTQTAKRLGYVWSVYTALYCGRFPRFVSSFRKGVYVPFFQVMTRSYPQLMSLYSLFYVNINGKMSKVITLDILPYLNPISLAY